MIEFDNKLQEDINERESVLFEIERTIFTKRYNLSQKHQDILATQSISIIYSIWEGFVQSAFNLYIDEINRFELEIYDFCDEIIIHHMENSFKQFRDYPLKESHKIKFFKDLKRFNELDKHNLNRKINTQSNVGFEVLNKLLRTFVLECFNEHWQAYTYPNPNLKDTMSLFIKLRNTVAHGGDLVSEEKIDHIVFIRFKGLIINLMYEIRLRMINGLVSETYKKKD